jgi:flavin-dependent dehydrogenase
MPTITEDKRHLADGITTSVWAATASTPQEKPLAKNASADVVVIGAGIAGLTTAYLLAQEGQSVAVLDDGPIGGGMTSRTTAHLTNALDDRFYELARLFGEEGARLAAQSHTAAVSFYSETVKIGTTSITVRVIVEAERYGQPGEKARVTQAEVVYVAVDSNRQKTEIKVK